MDMTTNARKISEPVRWERVEAGHYVRPIGLNRSVQLVHKDDTPGDKLHQDRWVVRLITHRPFTMTTLHRAGTAQEAKDWYAANRQVIA